MTMEAEKVEYLEKSDGVHFYNPGIIEMGK